MVYWIGKVRIHKWILFTFTYGCFSEHLFISIIELNIIGVWPLLGLRVFIHLPEKKFHTRGVLPDDESLSFIVWGLDVLYLLRLITIRLSLFGLHSIICAILRQLCFKIFYGWFYFRCHCLSSSHHQTPTPNLSPYLSFLRLSLKTLTIFLWRRTTRHHQSIPPT